MVGSYPGYPTGRMPLGPGGANGRSPGGGTEGPWNRGGGIDRGNPGGGMWVGG